VATRLSLGQGADPEQSELVGALLADRLLYTGSFMSFAQLCWRLLSDNISVSILGFTEWVITLCQHLGNLQCSIVFITFDFGLFSSLERGELKFSNRLGDFHCDLWLLFQPLFVLTVLQISSRFSLTTRLWYCELCDNVRFRFTFGFLIASTDRAAKAPWLVQKSAPGAIPVKFISGLTSGPGPAQEAALGGKRSKTVVLTPGTEVGSSLIFPWLTLGHFGVALLTLGEPVHLVELVQRLARLPTVVEYH